MVTKFQGSAADLHILRLPGDGESALIARTASEGALLVSGAIEGDLIGRETVATNRAGSGQRCVETATAVIEHDPGLLAERQAHLLIVQAADHVLNAAREGSADHRRDALAALRGVMADDAALPGDVMAGLRRMATTTVKDAAGSGTGTLGPTDLVQSIADADVTNAASDTLAPLRQRLQLEVRRLVRQRDAFVAAGRVDAGRGIDLALAEWSGTVSTNLTQHGQRQDDEAEEQLGAANAYLAEFDMQEEAAPRTGWQSAIQAWIVGFLYGRSDERISDGLRRPLESHLAARLRASAARELRAAVVAAGQVRIDEAAVGRILTPITLTRDGAARAVLTLDERADERQRRVNGILVPAHREIRDELVGQAIDLPAAALADILIVQPVAAELREGAIDIDQDRFEDAVLAGARRLTRPLRDGSLAQVLNQLLPARLDSLAKLLISPEPGLEFRAGYPTPTIYRRVALPGGPNSVLGQAVRRRAPEVEITAIDSAAQPLTAFGIAITEVFAPNDLAQFHGAWHDAREAARSDGTAARLVSDRRLLDLADGILSDEDVDDLIAKAIGCDVMASSKETAEEGGVGGTWYLMPDGQTQRPAQVDPTRLDSVFRGQRLGKSLPEIRRTLRNNPRHRIWIAEQWAIWCEDTRPVDRVARLAHVINGVRLPNDELVPVCRALKNREARLSRAPLTEVA